MNKGDLVLLDAPPRLDYAIFIERLPFDRMAAIEIIKERGGKGYSTPEIKGVRHITRQKYLKLILKAKELAQYAAMGGE